MPSAVQPVDVSSKEVKRSHKAPKRGRIRLARVEAPVLKKKTVTVRGMKKFLSEMMAAYAPFMLPEAAESIRHAMNHGDMKAAELTLKAYGVLQSPGISVTQTNVNAATSDNATHRSFESIIRNSSSKQGAVIDVPSEPKQLPCPSPSLTNSQPARVGKEIRESAS